MKMSLTRELEQLIDQKVKSGKYETASEVIREGLRLLKERDAFEALRRDVRAGFEQIERGDYEQYDEHTTRNLAEDIKARGRQRLAEMRKTRQSTRSYRLAPLAKAQCSQECPMRAGCETRLSRASAAFRLRTSSFTTAR
jgi:antitoxin ParD1/3/4